MLALKDLFFGYLAIIYKNSQFVQYDIISSDANPLIAMISISDKKYEN